MIRTVLFALALARLDAAERNPFAPPALPPAVDAAARPAGLALLAEGCRVLALAGAAGDDGPTRCLLAWPGRAPVLVRVGGMVERPAGGDGPLAVRIDALTRSAITFSLPGSDEPPITRTIAP
jgi:hypothetical protein